jgi:hypothetical protein
VHHLELALPRARLEVQITPGEWAGRRPAREIRRSAWLTRSGGTAAHNTYVGDLRVQPIVLRAPGPDLLLFRPAGCRAGAHRRSVAGHWKLVYGRCWLLPLLSLLLSAWEVSATLDSDLRELLHAVSCTACP